MNPIFCAAVATHRNGWPPELKRPPSFLAWYEINGKQAVLSYIQPVDSCKELAYTFIWRYQVVQAKSGSVRTISIIALRCLNTRRLELRSRKPATAHYNSPVMWEQASKYHWLFGRIGNLPPQHVCKPMLALALENIPFPKIFHNVLIKCVKHLQIFPFSIQDICLRALQGQEQTPLGEKDVLVCSKGLLHLEEILVKGI